MPKSVFAIDGGGTRVKWGIVSNAQVISSGIVDSANGTAQEHTERLLALHEQHAKDLPVVVSWAGKLNTGCSVDDLREAMAAISPQVRVVVDDMVAAGLGEADGRDIALLQVGTGVGGSIVRGGVVTKCITGHIVFRENGIPCSSGMRGTVDAYLGWKSLLRRITALEPKATAENPKDLLRLAEERDDASYILDDALEAAGFAASFLSACSGANTLVLAGGVAAAWDEMLVEAVRKGLNRRLWPARAKEVQVELSRHRENAPLLGLWRLCYPAPLRLDYDKA